jgi:hypothetical protein
VKPGIGGPWGGDWDNLVFGGKLSGGAMDWTRATNAVPNNRWGRFFIDCHSMEGPVLRNIKGYNWTIDTIEFIAANRGAQLISMQPGSICTIGALKLENGIYHNAVDLIEIGAGAHVKLAQFHIGGNAMVLHPDVGAITLFATGIGGPTGMFELDTLVAISTEFGGDIFVISGAKGDMSIRDISLDRHPWQLCDNTSTATGDTLTIDQYKNGHLSGNLGDANYVVTLGDPNVLSFETPFTSPRTLELPSIANSLFNGLYYEIRLDGAVNGENTLTIECGSTQKFVVRSDKITIRFAWRRNANAANGWIMTQYEALP